MSGPWLSRAARQRWQVPDRYNIAADVMDGKDPAAEAMIWQGPDGSTRRVPWRDIQQTAAQFADLVAEQGVQPGDRIAFVLPPLPETAATVLGAFKMGGIVVMLSSLWGRDALRYRILDAAPTVILTDADSVATVRAAAAGTSSAVIVLSPEMLAGRPATYDTVPTAAETPAMIFYTSGTTGPAKGIVQAHASLLGHNEFSACHDLQRGELFHGAGDWAWSLAKIIGPWRQGARHLVVHQGGRFDAAKLFAALSEHQVSNVLLNPTVLRRLREAQPDAGRRFGQYFRIACCSSEPLQPELAGWFAEQFGTPLLDYYGMTESYPMLGNRPGHPLRPGSIGRPLPGWEVTLLDDRGEATASGDFGEICLRARSNPQYPLGYWNRPEASEATFGGHWFRTGDLASRDEEGFYWYVSRSDDVIISAGYRIGPHDLEDVLRGHPAIAEVAVIGLPDARRGQVVCANVALADGWQPSDGLVREIQQYVKERYSRFAYPRVVRFVKEIPKTASNKLRRSALRAALRPATASASTTPATAAEQAEQRETT